MFNANLTYTLQKKIDLMLVNSVTGHGKALLRMSLDSDECQREVVSALGVEDSTMPLTLEVIVVAAVELATSKVMERFETLGIGIAKVHLRRLYRLRQRLEVLIDQRAVTDHQTDVTRRHGEKDDPRMAHGLQDVSSWRGHRWSEHRPRLSKTASGGRR